MTPDPRWDSHLNKIRRAFDSSNYTVYLDKDGKTIIHDKTDGQEWVLAAEESGGGMFIDGWVPGHVAVNNLTVIYLTDYAIKQLGITDDRRRPQQDLLQAYLLA